LGTRVRTRGAKPEAKKAPFDLYLWKAGGTEGCRGRNGEHGGFRQAFVVNDHATLTFSKDGSRLFFGAAPPAPPAHATAIDEDKPSFDLWNYKDEHIPPMQKVRATADMNHSTARTGTRLRYRAVKA
jgi:hypothetical protein